MASRRKARKSARGRKAVSPGTGAARQGVGDEAEKVQVDGHLRAAAVDAETGAAAGGDAADASKTRQARQIAAGAKLVSATFGEIVTLLMRAPGYRHYALSDLEWLVIPPLLANQFTLAEARAREGGLTAPVGVALWARVSDETDARLASALDGPLRLRPDEWQGGDNLWLIEAVGPPKIVQALLQRLKTHEFKGRRFKLRARDDAGRPVVREIAGEGVA